MKLCSECGREPFDPDVRLKTQCTAVGCSGVFVNALLPLVVRRAMEDLLKADDERRVA